ncbi:MAG: PH domain-containing protein, partial [Alphaproteobacteria bacterium]|nr:PH domain-containing protein [Alphaproteobacteria bacterium]
MLYVQQSLGADEELVHIGHFHWMYTLNAVLSIFWGVLACITVISASVYFQSNVMMEGVEPPSIIDQIQSLHPGVRLGA